MWEIETFAVVRAFIEQGSVVRYKAMVLTSAGDKNMIDGVISEAFSAN